MNQRFFALYILVSMLPACADETSAPLLPNEAPSVDFAAQGDATQKSAQKAPEEVFSLNGKVPNVSCSQEEPVAKGASNASIICRTIDSNGQAISTLDSSIGYRWSFAQASGTSLQSPPTVTSVAPANAPESVVKFTFADPASMELFYTLQKAEYKIEVFDKNNRVPSIAAKPSTTVTLKGEGCGGVAGQLSFSYSVTGWTNASNQTLIVASGNWRVRSGIKFNVRQASRTSTSLIEEGGSVGMEGGTAFALKGAQFEAVGTERTNVYADKDALIKAPADMPIKKFEQNLYYCQI